MDEQISYLTGLVGFEQQFDGVVNVKIEDRVNQAEYYNEKQYDNNVCWLIANRRVVGAEN